MTLIRQLAVVGLVWLISTGARAAEIEVVDLSHDNGIYKFDLSARIDAPVAAVFAVITDYDAIPDLHRRVRESRVLRRIDDNTAEVFTRLQGCVAFVFCRSLRRIERIQASPPDELVATVVPEDSDFRSGQVRWRLSPDGDATLLSYSGEFEPAFWIPPWMGDGLVARSFGNTAAQMISRVEELARESQTGSDIDAR
jgi:hypothetical protein